MLFSKALFGWLDYVLIDTLELKVPLRRSLAESARPQSMLTFKALIGMIGPRALMDALGA